MLDINFAFNTNSEIVTTINSYNGTKEEIYELSAKLLFLISVGGMAQRCYDSILAIADETDRRAILGLYGKYIENHHLSLQQHDEDEPFVSPLDVFKEEQI